VAAVHGTNAMIEEWSKFRAIQNALVRNIDQRWDNVFLLKLKEEVDNMMKDP
jgi:hypothetical protein